MFVRLLLLVLVPLCGCGTLLLNNGPSLSERGVARWLGRHAAPVQYTAARQTDLLVLPFQVFGVRYEHDVVVMTKARVTGFTMHEYARTPVIVDGERKNVWIAKDSDLDGVQTVTAREEHLRGNIDDVPVPRNIGEVVAIEDLTDGLDLQLSYTNHRGQVAEVWFHTDGETPSPNLGHRNGNTYNHSEQVVSAVIDISAQTGLGPQATFSLDGEPMRVKRLLGLAPIISLLAQTQVGFAVASAAQVPTPGGFQLVRSVHGEVVTEAWSVTPADCGALARFDNGLRSWSYCYSEGELVWATVEEHGVDMPLMRLSLSAPLPDLARPFAGEVVRNFTVQVNGQTHGHGTMSATHDGDGAVLQIRPAAPRWFRARPMESTVRVSGDGSVQLESVRVGDGGRP